MAESYLLNQRRRNVFDIGKACLTSTEGASVRGRAREGLPPLVGGLGASPEKILKFMSPVDAF